jgi:hypothetical protein
MAWLSEKEFKRYNAFENKLIQLRTSIREAKHQSQPTVFFCGGWLVVELAEKILEELTNSPKKGRPGGGAGRPRGS